MNGAAIRGVLFDLDGTLIDTAPDMIDSLNQLRGQESQPPLPYALARTQVSHGSSGLVRLAFPDADPVRFELLRERFLAIYNERVARDTTLFDGAVEVLEELEASQRPWGIVTNKPTFLTTPLLEAIGIGLRAGCVGGRRHAAAAQAASGAPAPCGGSARHSAAPVPLRRRRRARHPGRARRADAGAARRVWLSRPRRPAQSAGGADGDIALAARAADVAHLIVPAGLPPAPGALAGKVIAVTGATGGIGRAVALAVAAHGAELILIGRNVKKLTGLHAEITSAHGDVASMAPLDLEKAVANDYDQLAARRARARYGRLDGLVHCAGQLGTLTPIEGYDVPLWCRVLHVNLTAAFALTQVLLPALRLSKGRVGGLHHEQRRPRRPRVLGRLCRVEVRGGRVVAGARCRAVGVDTRFA